MAAAATRTDPVDLRTIPDHPLWPAFAAWYAGRYNEPPTLTSGRTAAVQFILGRWEAYKAGRSDQAHQYAEQHRAVQPDTPDQ